jgi:phage terminase large subunit GpA-like protein
VVEGEAAKLDRKAHEVWTNEVAAEVWDDSEESEQPPEWRTLWEQREDYANEHRVELPADCLVLTAAVDVQGNRLEIEWKAWGRDERSWGIETRPLLGNPRERHVWDALNRELARTFPRAGATRLSLSLCLVDAGWAADMVYAYLSRLARETVPGVSGKVRASKGIGEHGAPVIDLKWRTVAKNLKGHHIGTWEAKDVIYQRLKLADPTAAGFMHYSLRYDEAFFQQLTAERVTIAHQLVKGRFTEVRKYDNKTQARNEGLDLAVGNLAAIRKLRIWDWGTLEDGLKPEPKEPPPDTPTPAPIHRSNFATKGLRWR